MWTLRRQQSCPWPHKLILSSRFSCVMHRLARHHNECHHLSSRNSRASFRKCVNGNLSRQVTCSKMPQFYACIKRMEVLGCVWTIAGERVHDPRFKHTHCLTLANLQVQSHGSSWRMASQHKVVAWPYFLWVWWVFVVFLWVSLLVWPPFR